MVGKGGCVGAKTGTAGVACATRVTTATWVGAAPPQAVNAMANRTERMSEFLVFMRFSSTHPAIPRRVEIGRPTETGWAWNYGYVSARRRKRLDRGLIKC